MVEYLAPRVGNATVLFFNNCWQDPQSAIQPIPVNQIVFGFPGGGADLKEILFTVVFTRRFSLEHLNPSLPKEI